MNIAMTVVLIVVFALMLIMPYFTQKKRNKEYMDMLQGIKVGDLVKTAGGIIGKVNKITDKGEVKTVVLETGSKTQKSYLEMDMTMIYCVLNKTTKPADGTEETKPSEEIEETTAEVETVEPTEEVTLANSENEIAAETKAEEPEKKPAKKATTKRTSTKTSTRTSAKTSRTAKK